MKELMRLCLTYIDHFSSLQKLIPVFIENLVSLLSKKNYLCLFPIKFDQIYFFNLYRSLLVLSL